jgi:hypothetical protein
LSVLQILDNSFAGESATATEIVCAHAYLDIDQDPDILKSRSGQVLKQVDQAGHGFPWFFQGAQSAQIFPIAVLDLGVLAKASLQGAILSSEIIISLV